MGGAPRDQSEAAELIDSYLKTAPPESVYDALRTRGRDHPPTRGAEPPATAADRSRLRPREPLRVLGYAVNGAADEVALAMLANLIDDMPIAMEITALS